MPTYDAIDVIFASLILIIFIAFIASKLMKKPMMEMITGLFTQPIYITVPKKVEVKNQLWKTKPARA